MSVCLAALPQPAKDFHKSFFPSKDLKKLLDLPVQRRRAPLLLNYIPTYKSVLPDIPKKKSKSHPSATTLPVTSLSWPDQGSTYDLAEQPSTSAPYLIPSSQCKSQRRTAIAAKMGRKKAVAEDLLVDIPNTVNAQPTQPKPKPKRLKKAQPKATSEKTISVAEKRPAEAEPSQSTRSKRPRSESAITSGSMKSNAPWAPPITIEDKPIRASDSANDIEVSVALSTPLLLSPDLNRNAEMSEYENFALMLQRSVQAFAIKKELANKTKEAASLQRALNKAKGKRKGLTDQAEAAKKAQDEAEEKADAAEAITKVLAAKKKEAKGKMIEAQKELQDALATKVAEIKAADEKAYAEGAADVKEDYKK
ncbi:uncharacterized protein LOC114300161 [Camellia sinensis]|uniref:uncharacterized protein LOC114300161 n=1 Tax=Camellia sinensis TaxID=4442 RepID=UPI001036B3DD|nr:uncharacterized protein LOC114300161 [Camellia sinensis]